MREESKCDRCKRYGRLFFTFLFSHIGLCGLVVGYTIMGAFAFEALESQWELNQRGIIKEKRLDIVETVWEITMEMVALEEKNWTFVTAEVLRMYELELVTAVRSEGYDGKDTTDKELQWSFSGALLYTVTVITTIGYGNIAPKTPAGKVVTILYAAIGIPLMLLCLANIGDALANAFKFFYANICCFFCRKNEPKKKVEEIAIHANEIFMLDETSRSKIRAHVREDVQPDHSESGRKSNTNNYDHSSEMKTPENMNKPKSKAMSQRSTENITVPVSLCLLILVGYIFGGATLFSFWEKWDLLDGAYFCFITLSTVGFGDLVPGTDVFSTDAQEKLILCSVYLVFGMALLAMCFNLMQEEVTNRCRWIGQKIGIIEDPDEE